MPEEVSDISHYTIYVKGSERFSKALLVIKNKNDWSIDQRLSHPLFFSVRTNFLWHRFLPG